MLELFLYLGGLAFSILIYRLHLRLYSPAVKVKYNNLIFYGFFFAFVGPLSYMIRVLSGFLTGVTM